MVPTFPPRPRSSCMPTVKVWSSVPLTTWSNFTRNPWISRKKRRLLSTRCSFNVKRSGTMFPPCAAFSGSWLFLKVGLKQVFALAPGLKLLDFTISDLPLNFLNSRIVLLEWKHTCGAVLLSKKCSARSFGNGLRCSADQKSSKKIPICTSMFHSALEPTCCSTANLLFGCGSTDACSSLLRVRFWMLFWIVPAFDVPCFTRFLHCNFDAFLYSKNLH